MKQLFSIFYKHLDRTSDCFERYLSKEIKWNNRLIAITGARGCGKTTLLLQHIKKEYGNYPENVLYVSLDNIWFTTHKLYDLAHDFQLMGGEYLYLDEVHKYANWSREIKNIYDDFPEISVVFTGSSMLEIFKSDADLSRRAVHYLLQGMSFREYLIFEGLLDATTSAYTLDEILTNHVPIAAEICKKLKPIPAFRNYLKYGYYPYYKEDKDTYLERVLQTFNTIIEGDLPNVANIDIHSVARIKKLFYILSSLVPFTPNISKLSKEMDITRPSLLNYLHYLDKAQAIMTLEKEASGMSQMVKPEKIYVQNTNYMYALDPEKVDIGNVRETFFFNQVRVKYPINYLPETDFKVSGKYCFEIGGKNKKQAQISNLQHAYLALDDIETGFRNEIPLWLFGMLY
ncbi:ATP-binding protein [Bacteroides sp. 519]|uniref:ATP-binding protein n=1 Tax=Bacteroides sp. 519 TaxID=2302937 RepID=UPI0013D7DF00|nr:AAA family ATPase [Bacteroides sp. 519]NDV57731.1 AAA family ATPase [Bacteroides sp. 519]